MKILMVCLGNICRSPMAEGVMKKLLSDRLSDLDEGPSWKVDSAGIGSWHEGDRPDQRAISTARRHHIDISNQRARQIKLTDLDYFDHILVMDQENLEAAVSLSSHPDHHLKIKLLMDFKYPGEEVIVPDPYFTNLFEDSFKLIQEGCEAFVAQLANK